MLFRGQKYFMFLSLFGVEVYLILFEGRFRLNVYRVRFFSSSEIIPMFRGELQLFYGSILLFTGKGVLLFVVEGDHIAITCCVLQDIYSIGCPVCTRKCTLYIMEGKRNK